LPCASCSLRCPRRATSRRCCPSPAQQLTRATRSSSPRPPDAVAAVQRAGLKALPAGLPFEETQRRYTKAHGNELASLSPQERLAHILRHCLIGIAAPAMLEHLLPFARTWQPDLVIRNLGEPAAEVVATAAGVPHVIHGSSSPKSSYFAPVWGPGGDEHAPPAGAASEVDAIVASCRSPALLHRICRRLGVWSGPASLARSARCDAGEHLGF
jgi:hypothetical protein